MARKFGENGMDISKSKLFWRTQGECWRRMVTPYIMYLFMSMLLLATQALEGDGLAWLRYTLGIICILVGAAFNAHLAYGTGSTHYDAYLTGCIHRRNRAQGIMSGGDHHPEREFAVWKGFYIGFLVGLPVILFAGLACIPAAMQFDFGRFMLIMFAGYAIVPISWIVNFQVAPSSYYAFSMLLVLLPVIVTGVFYILGAVGSKRKKRIKEEREQAVLEAAEKAKQERANRVQTEEQRRKTLQSKKKK